MITNVRLPSSYTRPLRTDDDIDPRTGLVRDGGRVRALTMADTTPPRRLSTPMVINTRLEGEFALKDFFAVDGSPKGPRKRDPMVITTAGRKIRLRGIHETEESEWVDDTVTRDALAAHKPGYRTADAARTTVDAGQAVKDSAYADYCRWLQDAWKPDHQRAADARQVTADAACPAGVDPRDFAYHQRCLQDSEAWRTPPPVFDAAAVSTPPAGAFAPTGYGARAGDVCSLNGVGGRLVERDGWLFCEVTPVGATRSGTSSGDALTGRALVDAEWHALQERTQNAWRT